MDKTENDFEMQLSEKMKEHDVSFAGGLVSEWVIYSALGGKDSLEIFIENRITSFKEYIRECVTRESAIINASLELTKTVLNRDRES